jgi:hypothetical protein
VDGRVADQPAGAAAGEPDPDEPGEPDPDEPDDPDPDDSELAMVEDPDEVAAAVLSVLDEAPEEVFEPEPGLTGPVRASLR